MRQLRDYMDELNRRYNQTNNTQIGFYMKCEPSYINNSTHTTKTFTGATLLMGANREYGCINVHVIDAFNNGATTGFALKPLNACIVESRTYTRPANAGDLSHEIGHLLGLVHTHLHANWPAWTGMRRCLVEPVSRTRTWPIFNFCPTKNRFKKVCESTGDALKDTPADPDLIANRNCAYSIAAGDDPWGDSYDNPPNGNPRADVTNIMSYNTVAGCVDRFSRLQIAVMLRTIQWEKFSIDRWHWKDDRYTFDSFEPDYDPQMARPITLNEVQVRNFHQQYNRDAAGYYPNTTQCDVDWVSFVATCTGSFSIQTSELQGYTTTNTLLTLFGNNLNQLAQNDNISAGNLYSNITTNLTAGQTYFIRVENLSSATTGYYNLRILSQGVDPASYQISGASAICSGNENYTIPNLPAGSTIFWLVTPNIATVDQNGTVTASGNGTITLSANITTPCGLFTRTKTISVGSNWPDMNIYGPTYVSCGQIVTYYVSAVPGAGYQWSYPSSWIYNYGLGTNSITLQIPDYAYSSTSGEVRLLAYDACNNSILSTLYVSSSCGEYYYYYSLSPNPASSTVTVSTKETTPKGEKVNKSITEVNIYDQLGNIQKRQKFGKVKTATLNVSELKTGVYFVEIVDGTYKERQQLSIQR